MAGLAAMVVMGAIAMIAGLVAAKREKRARALTPVPEAVPIGFTPKGSAPARGRKGE